MPINLPKLIKHISGLDPSDVLGRLGLVSFIPILNHNLKLIPMTFTLEQFDNGKQFIQIPNEMVENQIGDTEQRLKCKLDNEVVFLSQLTEKEDGHYINIGEKISESLNIKPGENLSVSITEEIKEFSFQMPQELAKVLEFLPDIKLIFENLTEGRKRTYMQLIHMTETTSMKKERSSLIAQQLKMDTFNPWEII